MTKQQSSKRQSSPDGLLTFEAALRAHGHEPLLRWVTEGPRTTDFELHAGYCVGPDFVYVQALRGNGWRAFVAAPESDVQELIASLERARRPRLGGRRRDL